MKAIFHYGPGPRITPRFAALAGGGLIITLGSEEDDSRLAALLPICGRPFG